MKPAPKQNRSRQKRESLIAAAKTEFSDRGYDATTTKTITARAGVADGGFYQHFENKADLLRVLAQRRYDALIDTIHQYDLDELTDITRADDLKARLMNTVNLVYNFRADSPHFHKVLDQRRHVDPELNRIIRKGETALQKRVREFVSVFAVEPVDPIAFAVYAMIEGVVLRHINFPSRPSRTKVLDSLGDCIAQYVLSLARR